MKLAELIGDAPAVVMIGMCKNAGKTTAMNSLITELAKENSRTIALTSIGRDGESRDLVTGTDKPAIYMNEGMLAATAESLLSVCDASREILGLPEMYTSMGQVVIFKARSDGFVQLAGPSIVDQMSELRKWFRSYGADCTIIDGALSRRSPAAAAKDGACILSTGASLDRDINTVVDETAFVAELLTLPEMSSLETGGMRFTVFDGDEIKAADEVGDLNLILKERGRKDILVSVKGAFTDSHAQGILKGGSDKEGITILADDSSKYLLKRGSYDLLKTHGVTFAVRANARLAAITVNPVSAGGWRFDDKELLEKMRGRVSVPVLDVKAK